MENLTDALGRRIRYMRVSVADSCNLRCVYCMPASGMRFNQHRNLMSPEEIEIIVKAAARLGTSTVRLTGGEPLTRHDICDIASRLSEIRGIEDIPISTNGIFLYDWAERLSSAGVTRANISLDTLKPGLFSKITRGGDLNRVLRGIKKAEESGIFPIKLNTVMMKGINDTEMTEIAHFALSNGYTVRFIEMMPLWSNVEFQPELFLSAQQGMLLLSDQYNLVPDDARNGLGPAVYYKVDGYEGRIGFITPISHNFCSSCNRIRITSDGRLRMCLFGDAMFNLVGLIRQGAGPDEVADKLRELIPSKPERHYLGVGRISSETLFAMSQTGG